jgi:radical SAM superfamily enzyme
MFQCGYYFCSFTDYFDGVPKLSQLYEKTLSEKARPLDEDDVITLIGLVRDCLDNDELLIERKTGRECAVEILATGETNHGVGADMTMY